MFKNKKFEVKMVDDVQMPSVPKESKPRLTDQEIDLVKTGAKVTAGLLVTLKVIDAATKIAVKAL